MLQIDGVAQRYEVGGVPVVLDRRHAVLVNSQELHANQGDGEGRSIVLMLYLSPDWVTSRFPALPPAAKLFSNPSVLLTPALCALATALAQAMQHAVDIDAADVQQLFGTLAEQLCEAYACVTWSRAGMGKLNDFRIRRAISLMQDSIEEPLSAGELCARVGLSRSRFFELFTECTGLSPKHYANMLRLDVATQRLAGDQERIGEISHKCGFGAQSHFSKFFVEQQGFTPREFRRAAAPLTLATGR